MSAPAFVWAFEKGHELRLSANQLLLLLYMADQANCKGEFWTGQPRIAKFTRLCIRTVRELIPQLRALGLIDTLQQPGKATRYRILRQPLGEATAAGPATHAGRANGAGAAEHAAPTPAPAAGGNGAHPGKSAQAPRQMSAPTPAPAAADPLSTQEKKTLKPASARVTRDAVAAPDGRAVAPLAPAPTEAPSTGTTEGSVPAKPPTDPFDDGGTSKDWMGRRLGRTVHLAAAQPDTVTEDDRPKTEEDRQRMAAQMAAAAAALEAEFRERANRIRIRFGANAPGQPPRFTAEEQAAIAAGPPRVKPYFLAGAQLAAARRLAGIWPASSPDA